METKKREPGVRSARAPKSTLTISGTNTYTESEREFQAARIMARRFFLSLDHARLICELARGGKS